MPVCARYTHEEWKRRARGKNWVRRSVEAYSRDTRRLDKNQFDLQSGRVNPPQLDGTPPAARSVTMAMDRATKPKSQTMKKTSHEVTLDLRPVCWINMASMVYSSTTTA